jgi:hypothetical protein
MPGAILYPATNSTRSYTVSWSAVMGATSYVLEESLNGGAWGNAVTVGTNSYTFSGKANGNYIYRVKAKRSGYIDSAWKVGGTLNVAYVQPVASMPGMIGYPTSSANGNFTIYWSTVTGTSGYVLEESSNDGSSWGNAVTVATNNYIVIGKASGTYVYRVKAQRPSYTDSAWKTGTAITIP